MNLKLITICFLSLALLGGAVLSAWTQSDIDEHRSCAQCGMDRKAFGFSRMLVSFQDGAKVGVCSVHCAVADLNGNKGREVKSLLVADRNTRTLIDAEKAIWVIGGRKRGVMTKLPTWAFETKAAAEEFIASNGGAIAGWNEVLTATRGQ